MLNNFFRINMPYGIAPNEDGEWIAFNREYMPLGYNSKGYAKHLSQYTDQPVYSKFKGLTDRFLEKIIDIPSYIQRGKDGSIVKVVFYDDGNNPSDKGNSQDWNRYLNILKKLAVLEVKN